MKANLNRGVIMLILCLGFFACHYDPIPGQQLVAKTYEGRNTIGYKISEGKLIGGEFGEQDSIITHEDGAAVSIYHNADSDGANKIQLFLIKDTILDTYLLDSAGYKYRGVKGDLDASFPGYFSIDYQTENILSGTFGLNFVSIDSTYDADSLVEVEIEPLLELENGRFDIRY
ncbi:MAG: hypothetical protein GQ574_21295 [Crocinitomix sp.]|nr:hypothetical protein [Crocinitomix sp.]